MSPPARTILLGVGWALVVVALATAIVGVKTGTPVLSLVGALAGLSAWTVSGLMPEPLPAPRKSVRRRLDSIHRLSGHRLPD